MMEEYSIARSVVLDYIFEKKKFKMKELEEEILNKGGLMRVGPAYPVRDYVYLYEERGIIKYNFDKKEYSLSKEFSL
jgi:hypothetical protein